MFIAIDLVAVRRQDSPLDRCETRQKGANVPSINLYLVPPEFLPMRDMVSLGLLQPVDLSARPGRILCNLPVRIHRPRTMESMGRPDFISLVAEVRSHLQVTGGID